MNIATKAIAITAVSTLALLALANPPRQGCGNCAGMAQRGAHRPGTVAHAQSVKGVQKATVTVANGTYNPATINVAKGKPVELTFKLGDRPGCGTVLVIKDLKVNKELQVGKSEVVKFTPTKAGSIGFTCGMGMFKGTIVVK
jgi:plastocyanin domain-containing protein